MSTNTIVITNVSVKDNKFFILAKTPTTPEIQFTFINDTHKSLTENVIVALKELVGMFNTETKTPTISVNMGSSLLTDDSINIIYEVYRVARYMSKPVQIGLTLHKHLVDSGVEVTTHYGDKSMKTIIPAGEPNPVTEIQKLLPELLDGGSGLSMYIGKLTSEELSENFPLKVVDCHVSGTISAGWTGLIESEPEVRTITPLVDLASMLFNPENEFSPNAQGVCAKSGSLGSSNYSLNVAHVLGNFFIEGTIGYAAVIITKTNEGIQCHSAPMYEKDLLLTDKETLVSFSSHQEKDFLKWLYSLFD